MVLQCVELRCTLNNVEAGMRGAHPTRAKVTLVCERFTVVIVLLLADAEQAERDCIIASGLRSFTCLPMLVAKLKWRGLLGTQDIQ